MKKIHAKYLGNWSQKEIKLTALPVSGKIPPSEPKPQLPKYSRIIR